MFSMRNFVGDHDPFCNEIQSRVLIMDCLTAQSAPPVVLIDDPIAHIDDLNALSFMDYLRDLSVHSRRQIFFATADSRVAELFEKKFAFLGPEKFQRIDLARRLGSID